MLKVLEKFGGALLLYAVIFFGIVAVASSMERVNQEAITNEEVIALKQ